MQKREFRFPARFLPLNHMSKSKLQLKIIQRSKKLSKLKILTLLAENPEKEYTLPEIAKEIGRDRSNTGKQVRSLAKQGKLKYTAGDRINPSLVSFLPYPTLPHPTLPKPKSEKKALHKKMHDALTEARENGKPEKEISLTSTSRLAESEKQQKRTYTPRKPEIPDFNQFMEKLEKSNSASSKHLKEKMKVKGKHRSINKERVFRIIRDVIDTIKE